ncbi:8695_t:CDS:2 [Gigaspora margarita]|uniref:8695_t:CDS:1 n=1 Tax=Gigaspora margarita TaxID=4874 RepID=A0ABM8W270_GIGMA|nr:8695_t:CDS:2 [Gigaspora margarita]
MLSFKKKATIHVTNIIVLTQEKQKITPVISIAKITLIPTTGRSNTNKESTFNDNTKNDKITNHTNDDSTKDNKNYSVVLKTMTLKKTNWCY